MDSDDEFWEDYLLPLPRPQVSRATDQHECPGTSSTAVVTLTEGAGSIAVAAPGTEDTVAVVDVGSSYELHDGAELDADAARVIKKLEATRRQLSSKCRTLEAQRSVGGQGTDSRHAILTLTKKIDDIDRDIALLQQGADPGSIGNDVANASVPDAPLVAAAADDAHHHTPHGR